MRPFLLFALVLVASPIRLLGWEVTSNELLPSMKGSEFRRVRLEEARDSAEVYILSAKSQEFTFSVIDNPDSSLRVATAGETAGAIATVNGGYFHPDGTPLGLVISAGKKIHGSQKASLLSGLVIGDFQTASLLRATEYISTRPLQAALQAGPFLLDRGEKVPGLNSSKVALRTFAFTCKGGLFGVGQCRSLSLEKTARALATPGILPGRSFWRVLNLDGGSSSGMWVQQPGTSFSAREWKTVRNFLAIVPKGGGKPR